ncbi:8890_t:CDS:2, partial [Racocetra persica]
MQFELDLLKQRITELEDENTEVKAENVELKHENTKLKQIIEENVEFKAKIVKLERAVDKIEKRDQSINNDSQRELAHSCQVNTPKQIVDTTIRPCLSTADVIRFDVNQESKKNLIVEQELIQQLSVIIGRASIAENKEYHITAETKASESSVSHISDSLNLKGNISIPPTSIRADMMVPKPLIEKVLPKTE